VSHLSKALAERGGGSSGGLDVEVAAAVCAAAVNRRYPHMDQSSDPSAD